MSSVYNHPAMESMAVENDRVVSVYNGVRIPTGRKRTRKFGFGDLDPLNSRLGALIAGNLDVSELDNEEVTFGITKCDDGKFSAKAAWQASHIPRAIRAKIQRELYRRANDKLHAGLLGAVDSIVELATEPWVDENVRFNAAKYVLERLQGKTPEVHVHSQEAPWEMVLSGVERGPRPVRTGPAGLPDPNVEDAEIVED